VENPAEAQNAVSENCGGFSYEKPWRLVRRLILAHALEAPVELLVGLGRRRLPWQERNTPQILTLSVDLDMTVPIAARRSHLGILVFGA